MSESDNGIIRMPSLGANLAAAAPIVALAAGE